MFTRQVKHSLRYQITSIYPCYQSSVLSGNLSELDNVYESLDPSQHSLACLAVLAARYLLKRFLIRNMLSHKWLKSYNYNKPLWEAFKKRSFLWSCHIPPFPWNLMAVGNFLAMLKKVFFPLWPVFTKLKARYVFKIYFLINIWNDTLYIIDRQNRIQTYFLDVYCKNY